MVYLVYRGYEGKKGERVLGKNIKVLGSETSVIEICSNWIKNSE